MRGCERESMRVWVCMHVCVRVCVCVCFSRTESVRARFVCVECVFNFGGFNVCGSTCTTTHTDTHSHSHPHS